MQRAVSRTVTTIHNHLPAYFFPPTLLTEGSDTCISLFLLFVMSFPSHQEAIDDWFWVSLILSFYIFQRIYDILNEENSDVENSEIENDLKQVESVL